MADLYEPRTLPADMLEVIQVRAVAAFGLGDRLVTVGEVVTMSKHRADYLRFLQLVELI